MHGNKTKFERSSYRSHDLHRENKTFKLKRSIHTFVTEDFALADNLVYISMHESTYSKILSKHTLNSHKNIPRLASFKIARG